MKGGKVIGSGSYGCVFKPPLKCKTRENNRRNKKNKKTRKNIISKLVLNSEGVEEYIFNKTVINRIKKLDNYKNISKHFIVIDDLCAPAELKNEDKKSLMKDCNNMVTEEYLENKLKNLGVLNMKYGGISLDNFIILNMISKESNITNDINKLIDLLIDLIENGISNIHKVDLYHTDIKSLNLLISNNKKYISIIDWGLSVLGLPKHLDNMYSGIHFNRPYESLLFNINDNEIIMDRELLVDKIISSYLEKILSSTLQDDLKLLFKSEENSLIKLKKYLLEMLDKVIINNRFSKEKLIKAFYVKQDYWGLMTVLMDLYKYLNLRKSIYDNDFRNIFEYMTGNLRVNKSVFISLLKKLKRE